MATPKLFFFLLITAAFASSALSSTTTSSTEFIRTSCNSTSYPDLCYSSLAKYSKTVNHSSLQFAQIAANVSLSFIYSATTRASAFYQKASAKGAASAKALADCVDLLGDAGDNTKGSIAELKKMKGVTGDQLLWKLSNVQTWMSSALTKEETCTDGLKEVKATAAATSSDMISGSVGQAKQYTSNALGLVNRLRYSYT